MKEVKELEFDKEVLKRIEMICRFACVKYKLINGSVISFKNINIFYAKSHILKVNGNIYSLFDECEDIFINGYEKKIKSKDLEKYLKENQWTSLLFKYNLFYCNL